MKKSSTFLFILLLAAYILTGCEKGNEVGTQIEMPNQSEKTHHGYADDVTTGGFTFTARSSWTATVSETTRSSGVSWIQLLLDGKETYNGNAGKFTLTIQIEPNFSGVNRTANIVVQSGNDIITVTVTQEGKTKKGEVPKDPDSKLPINMYGKFVSQITFEEDGNLSASYIFGYDEQGRVIKLELQYEGENENLESIISYPENNTIKIDAMDAGEPYSYIVTLNDNGYASSIYSPERDYKYVYTYNNGYVSSCQHGNSIDKYTWQNGNLVSYKIGKTDPINFEYTTHLNNYKINLDLNMLFTEEIETFSIFDWMGKRSKNYILNGVSLLSTDYKDPIVNEDYTIFWEISYNPLSYTFDKDGYASAITLPRVEKQVKTITATEKKEILSEKTIVEVWRIIYTK